MSAWKVLLLAAIALNGLAAAALFFVSQSFLIQSLAAGAFLPVLISTLLLFSGEKFSDRPGQKLQQINIFGFFLKLILLGGWAVFMLKSGALDKVTFIVSLLINFLAWHGVEAYYWPLFMAGQAPLKGEKS